MKLTLNPEKTALTTSDPTRPTVAVTCVVRNELNKQRGGQDVTHTMPSGQPYMPREFPKGTWKLGKPVAKTEPYTAPWFIPTDAWQMVDVWGVDEHGFYTKPSGQQVKDVGYGLHNSTSRTTLGCLKVTNKADLLWLVEVLGKEAVTLEVQ